MLQQTAYVGRVIWNRRLGSSHTLVRPAAEWIEIPAPRLVSDSTFAKAQALLHANRTRLSGRPPRGPSPLRGLLWCGACGRRLYLTTNRRGQWVGRYYRCTSKDALATRICRTPLIRAEPLEAVAWETVVGLLREPALFVPAFDVAQVRLGVCDVEVRSELEHLRRDQAAIARKLAATAELLGDPDMPHRELRARLAALEDQRRHVEGRLEIVQNRLLTHDARVARGAAVREFCAEFAARLETLGQTPDGRAFVLARCVDRMTWRDGRVEIQVALPVSVQTVTASEIAEPA
jgi:hypothetical protein